MRRRWLLGVALLVGVLLFATAGQASVRAVELETLGERSELIVKARVTGVQSVERAGPFGVYTDYELSVSEVFKGLELDAVTVRHPGGESDAGVLRVADVPDLELGREYLLVLVGYDAAKWGEPRDSRRYYVVLGSSQGVFAIAEDGMDPICGRNLVGVVDTTVAGARSISGVEQWRLSEVLSRLLGGGRE